MTCHELQHKLKHKLPPDDHDREHAQSCTPCALLLEDSSASLIHALNQLEPASSPPAPDFSNIQAQLRAESGVVAWLRSRPSPLRSLFALSAATLVVLFALFAMPRVDLGLYPPLRMALALGLLSIAGLSTLSFSLRGLHRPRLSPRGLMALVILAGLAVPFALALLPPAHSPHPAALQGAGSDLWSRAAECFFLGLALATPVVLMARALSRDAHHRPLMALLAAAAAGITANLALQLHCPIVHPIHLVLSHASVAATALLGYAVVLRRLRPMSATSATPPSTPGA